MKLVTDPIPAVLRKNEKKKLFFVNDYLKVRDDIKRRDIAKSLGYTDASGFNVLLSKCDDMRMSVMYSLFDLLGCELEIDLRNENDPPTDVSINAFPASKKFIRPLLAAMQRYQKSLKQIARDLGLFEGSMAYYNQKGDITFSKLCDIAFIEGWSVFINIKEKEPSEEGCRFHLHSEVDLDRRLEEFVKDKVVERATKAAGKKTKKKAAK